MAVAYRVWQLARALTAHCSLNERIMVVQSLHGAELLLFERMSRFDQRHCLDVYYALLRGGYDDPALMQAALLHDCGKVDNNGQTIPLLYYGLFVILKHLAPTLYGRAARDGRGLLRPFAIHAVHEQRSAALAAWAGSSPEVVAVLHDLALQRRTPATDALHWADDQC